MLDIFAMEIKFGDYEVSYEKQSLHLKIYPK